MQHYRTLQLQMGCDIATSSQVFKMKATLHARQ